MLDALRIQLQERHFGDVKVVDLAESVGVTAAAFYQYFINLEDALFALTSEMMDQSRRLTDLMAWDWQNNGREVARQVVEEFVEFWDRHGAVLRVVELGVGEGDERFANVRAAWFNEPILALSFVIASAKAAGVQPADVEPRALAAGLAGALVHVGSRLRQFQEWGLEPEDLKRGLADMLFTMVRRQDCG
jgi:AcrR family transcriptional regulator